MKNCNTCIYTGRIENEITYDRYNYMTETRYGGIRCTNKNCIFYKTPVIPLLDAGLDNCKGYKEK